ncbi:PAS domain-containing protein [Salinarimonas ramus]|uniref:PAS domain-containing protein n=1 Tax=Salinarimonas ramus TaxID=690164 RepID=A0A917QAW2_9HYPH|nr:PAS domain-containing protein [Salinarimonas ramus]GGK39673.1 hypothetical protein GCM10011322_28520 [Salinarimonas ramus]
MFPLELIALLAHHLATAVVITEPDLDFPGPTIRYVNPAFLALTGYQASELLGASPRLLHGPETSRTALAELVRALRDVGSFHGVLANYRRGGERYLCEIRAFRIDDDNGRPANYVAFEREVVRRRGRPRAGTLGRYKPVLAQTQDELVDLFAKI